MKLNMIKKKEVIVALQKKRIDAQKGFVLGLLNTNSNIPNFRVSTKKTLLSEYTKEIPYLPATLNILPVSYSLENNQNHNIILAKVKNKFYFKNQFKQTNPIAITLKLYNSFSVFKKFYFICKKLSLTKK